MTKIFSLFTCIVITFAHKTNWTETTFTGSKDICLQCAVCTTDESNGLVWEMCMKHDAYKIEVCNKHNFSFKKPTKTIHLYVYFVFIHLFSVVIGIIQLINNNEKNLLISLLQYSLFIPYEREWDMKKICEILQNNVLFHWNFIESRVWCVHFLQGFWSKHNMYIQRQYFCCCCY